MVIESLTWRYSSTQPNATTETHVRSIGGHMTRSLAFSMEKSSRSSPRIRSVGSPCSVLARRYAPSINVPVNNVETKPRNGRYIRPAYHWLRW